MPSVHIPAQAWVNKGRNCVTMGWSVFLILFRCTKPLLNLPESGECTPWGKNFWQKLTPWERRRDASPRIMPLILERSNT